MGFVLATVVRLENGIADSPFLFLKSINDELLFCLFALDACGTAI